MVFQKWVSDNSVYYQFSVPFWDVNPSKHVEIFTPETGQAETLKQAFKRLSWDEIHASNLISGVSATAGSCVVAKACYVAAQKTQFENL